MLTREEIQAEVPTKEEVLQAIADNRTAYAVDADARRVTHVAEEAWQRGYDQGRCESYDRGYREGFSAGHKHGLQVAGTPKSLSAVFIGFIECLFLGVLVYVVLQGVNFICS